MSAFGAVATCRQNSSLALAAHLSKSRPSASGAKSRFMCRNRRARREYQILDELECGIALIGNE